MKYTKEQLDWLKKHALDDKYLDFLYPNRKKKKKTKNKKTQKLIIYKKSPKAPSCKKPKRVKENLTYAEQLIDKRWLIRRKEILNKKGYVCSKCGSTLYLQVHHLRYVWGKMAWEYKDKDLIVLCSLCHEKAHCIDLDKEFYSITN